MNIFFLYLSAKLAASSLCDKHIIKMVLETAQLLSGAVQILLDLEDVKLYKVTHHNHPCAVWTRESRGNFEWLISYGLELCYEYTRRYHRIHKSQAVMEYIQNKYTRLEFPSESFTMPPKCMPDQYKISNNVVECYREYYKKDKVSFAKWKYTDQPHWW